MHKFKHYLIVETTSHSTVRPVIKVSPATSEEGVEQEGVDVVSAADFEECDELPERFAQNFRRALAHMPWAAHPSVMKGNVVMGSYRDPLTGTEVIEALEALTSVLRTAAAEHDTTESNYAALRRDVAAFRRIIGTADHG